MDFRIDLTFKQKTTFNINYSIAATPLELDIESCEMQCEGYII